MDIKHISRIFTSLIVICILTVYYFCFLNTDVRSSAAVQLVIQKVFKYIRYIVPAPPGSAAICETVFPSKSVVTPVGCEGNINSPGLIFECYLPIVLNCNDSLVTARDKYYRHIARDHCFCSNSERFGNNGDGGWNVCLVEPFVLQQNNCIVYSFGINNDWSFDEAITEKYGCLDFAFDPSIGLDDHKHSDKIWFYDIGLGGKNEENNYCGWKMRTLSSIFKLLGHVNKTIDILKFDIEFSEWDVIASMLRDDALRNVKQIAFEIHSWRDTTKDYVYFWQQMQGLENAAFYRFNHQQLNSWCFYPEGDQRYCPQVNMNFLNARFISR